MKAEALLVLLTVFPATILGGCANVTSCSSDFSTEGRVDCQKLADYISCLKTSGCDEVAQNITSLSQTRVRECGTEIHRTETSVFYLFYRGSLSDASVKSHQSCSALKQCTSDSSSAGLLAKPCTTYKPVMSCWKRAQTSCSLTNQLVFAMTQVEVILDILCSDPLVQFFANATTSNPPQSKACSNLTACVFKKIPSKDGQFDVKFLQNALRADKPALCRLYNTMFSCLETAGDGCEKKQDLEAGKPKLAKICGDPNTAESLTSRTMLIHFVSAIVIILHM
ncbi:uncharacterized protein LOC121388078 [Gigantopelta aegis]|uniref:uncharacterized protein LOC121388078 n=1 Tax=Gigantopelta aegis TaxID=1735272 RepID=UPI001B88AD4D|nr:uncharacterized protein LOC121388078 [Gigantopelta aegis]